MRFGVIVLALIMAAGCQPPVSSNRKDVANSTPAAEQPKAEPVKEDPPEEVNKTELAVPDVEEPATSMPEAGTMFGKSVKRVWSGKCAWITDGDTLVVVDADQKRINVSLESIDCPEMEQVFGKEAKSAVSELCLDKQVEVHETGTDKYQRILGFVVIDGVNINSEMIRRGMAWHYIHFSKSDDLKQAEATARESKLGLWADAEPTPPWDFRNKK